MTGFSISVAMCTFNGRRFLRPQLESIARQSLQPSEVIICDDQSSDDTAEIVREFARAVAFPVRFEVNPVNLGSTKNFEKTIGLCSSQIVALADQDDVWYPHKLQRITEAFVRAGVVAVFSDADLINEEGKGVGSRLWPTFGFTRAEQKMLKSGGALEILVRHSVVTGACMAFRRECFDRLIPIPADEIHDQWISFLLAAAGQIEVISEPLVQYRCHSQQQIGPRPLQWHDRMALAKKSGKDFYLAQIGRLNRLHKKLNELAEDFPYTKRAQEVIQRKITHLERRVHLPSTRPARVPRIVHEVLNGNYWRCSDGWRSVAKDLMFP